jgi:hypothetical protein
VSAVRLFAALIVLLALASAATVAEGRTPVRAPKSGMYQGSTSQHRKLSLQISGRTVSLALFRFSCGEVRGTGSIQDIRLKKGRTGYRFAIFAFSGIQYTDEESENAPVRMRGLFSRDGKRVRGRLRVTTDRCGTTRVRWSARRRTVAYPLPS